MVKKGKKNKKVNKSATKIEPAKDTEQGKSIVLRQPPRIAELPVIRPSDVRAEMNRWFDDMRSEMEQRIFSPWLGMPQPSWMDVRQPSMDIIDKGNEFEIHAEMPGIPRENIEINVTRDAIEISGESENKTQEGGEGDYLRQERTYSSFYRSTPLPAEVVADKVEATMQDGILVVRLPKKEPTPERKTHKVKVK